MSKVKEFFLKYYVYIFCAVIIAMPYIYVFTTISKAAYALVFLVSYILFEVVSHINKKRETTK